MSFLSTLATAMKQQAGQPSTSSSVGGWFNRIMDVLKHVLGDKISTPTDVQMATGALNGIAQQLTPAAPRTPEELTTNPGGPAELPTRQAVELPGIYQHQQDIADRLRAQFEPRFAGRFSWDGQLGALHAVQAHERNAARALAGLGGEGGGLPPVLPPAGDGGGGVAPPPPAPPPVGDGGSGGLPPLTPPPVMPPAGDGTLPPVAPPLPPVDTIGGGGSTTTPTSPLNQIASGPAPTTAPAEPITAVAPPPSWSPIAPPALAPITSTTVSPIAQPSASDAALLQYLAAMQPMTTPTGTSQLQFGYPSGDLAPLVTYDPVTGMMMLKEMAAAYNQ